HDTFDTLGRQALHVDFKGQVTALVYDDSAGIAPAERLHLGRLVEKRFYASMADYANGTGTPADRVHFTYDSLGRQATMTDSTGLTTCTYDAESRLTEKASPEGDLHYAYNPATGQHTETF